MGLRCRGSKRFMKLSWPFLQSQGAPCPRRQQSASHEVEIGKGEHGVGLGEVLGDAAVAHLGEAPQALNDVEGMLDAGANARARAIDEPLCRSDLVSTAAAAVHPVTDAGLAAQPAMLLTPVGAVAVYLGLFAVEQF